MPSEFVFALRYRDFAPGFSRARFSTAVSARGARARSGLSRMLMARPSDRF